MPIPNPNPGETERDFVARCIPVLIDEGKPSDQAAAICYDRFDNPVSKEVTMDFEETDKAFTGAMVGMFLPLAASVALDMVSRDLPFYVDRTKARDYHLTLAYLGDLTNQVLPVDEIRSAIEGFANSHSVLVGRFGGIGRMSKSDNGHNAVYANFDSPDLPQFRQDLVDVLQSVGVFQDPEHGFIPHITLGYMSSDIEETPHLELPEIDFELSKVTLALGDERIDFKLQGQSVEKSLDGFSVIKDKSGVYRWISVSSTAYQDREKQIVSQKALSQAVQINDARSYHGPLRWWHVGGYDKATLKATDGLDIGDCDFSWARGKFLVESGTFKKPEYAEKLKSYDGQVSIRFLHPQNEPDDEGVFENIVIFERSLLPRGKAANPFTSFTISKEKTPMDDKVKDFVELLGDSAFAESVVASLEKQQSELDPEVKSKEDDNGLLSRIKALVQKEETVQDSNTDPEPDVSWVPTEENMKSIVVAAVSAAVAATQKTAVEEDTEKAMKEAQKHLTDRIAKLESELSDAKKELGEISGSPGYRASEDPNTVTEKSEKPQNVVPDRSGLDDFSARVSGQVAG